jgi:hypothetical protein
VDQGCADGRQPLLQPGEGKAPPTRLLIAAPRQGHEEQRRQIGDKTIVENRPIELLTGKGELDRHERGKRDRHAKRKRIPAQRNAPDEEPLEPGPDRVAREP